MKIAPLYHTLGKEPWAAPIIVHTGQHYDLNMSDNFFKDLRLPDPDIHLGVGSGSHAEQTGQVMITYEKVLLEEKPDLIIVVGDVNSTMAATIAGVKLGIKVAHLEAGLRSFDRSMPEEINRLVTDSLADLLWTPSPDADNNLVKEGISHDKIQRVGNIMIDSLEMIRDQIEKQEAFKRFGFESGTYGIVTLHRPSNVDNLKILKRLCKLLSNIALQIPLIFPIHPRTRKNLEHGKLINLLKKGGRLYTPEPLSYIHFLNLIFNCRFVITDSGGIQEETSYLGIPCLTLRPNTERPITIQEGTNQLCNLENLKIKAVDILTKNTVKKRTIEFWDGHTSERVVESIKKYFSTDGNKGYVSEGHGTIFMEG